jgi:hypothetical protein
VHVDDRAVVEPGKAGPAETESASVTKAPPVTATFLSLPSCSNASHRASGEKMKLYTLPVPDSGVASEGSRALSQILRAARRRPEVGQHRSVGEIWNGPSSRGDCSG